MKVLIVYESMFGNTEEIARAVAAGLRESADVQIHEVSDVPPDPGDAVDLVVAGGPTHAFSMSRPSTRTDAIEQGASHGSTATGLREWLDGLGKGSHHQLVAAFDTRVAKVRHLPGSAAKSAAKTLRRLGYSAALKPESFYVSDTAGPLLDGELQRAEEWGCHLGIAAQERFADR
jgi:flavodoxin